MRVLSWNLFHGRSLPATGRQLRAQFAARIAAWDWDVALLQEVPPWWPASLARDAGAEQRTALTSRNGVLALRRLLAERRPELVKSNGGGANAILSRQGFAQHGALRLRTWPERRVAQLAKLAGGLCVVNFHASAPVALAEDELARLWDRALAWSGGAPLVLGGDLNLRRPHAPDGVAHVACRDVDHIFVRGLDPVAEAELLGRRAIVDSAEVQLSDHVPLAVDLERAAS